MADQGSEGLLSPYLREKRMQAVTPWLKGRILDFGCGTGTLATLVDAERYLGVERDEDSLQQARKTFSKHRFISGLSGISEKFDTIIALAVIEHFPDPTMFLCSLTKFLEEDDLSRIVITTPHPAIDWIHSLGAKIGLFSGHANEEHQDLLDRSSLEIIGKQAGLKLSSYSRFLFGTNQIAIYVNMFSMSIKTSRGEEKNGKKPYLKGK